MRLTVRYTLNNEVRLTTGVYGITTSASIAISGYMELACIDMHPVVTSSISKYNVMAVYIVTCINKHLCA